MSVLTERLLPRVIESDYRTAAERANIEWGVGRAARTLADFADRSDAFPPRDETNPRYNDRNGDIILGYN